MPKNKNYTRKQAQRMHTSQEKGYGISVFDSYAWETRKKAIADRVKRKAREARAKSLVRKEQMKPGSVPKNDLRIATDIVKKLEKLEANKKPFISKRSLKK